MEVLQHPRTKRHSCRCVVSIDVDVHVIQLAVTDKTAIMIVHPFWKISKTYQHALYLLEDVAEFLFIWNHQNGNYIEWKGLLFCAILNGAQDESNAVFPL